MTTDTDTTLQSLAEATTECPCITAAFNNGACDNCYHDESHSPHCDTVPRLCTAEVPLFDKLRKDCYNCHGEAHAFRADGSVAKCQDCQGRTWVVAQVDLASLMVMAQDAGFFLVMTGWDYDHGEKGFTVSYLKDTIRAKASATKPMDALVEALGQAVQARQEVT